MPQIRILAVDHSVVIHRMACDALPADSQREAGGAAAKGKPALARIPQFKREGLPRGAPPPPLRQA